MIARFNQQNPRYRVEIRNRNEHLSDSPLVSEQAQVLLNEILLYERHPDILFCMTEESIAAHADKNIYVDLNELLQTELLSAVKECYSLNRRLYQIPFMFQMDTLAANPSNRGAALPPYNHGSAAALPRTKAIDTANGPFCRYMPPKSPRNP